MSQPESSQPQDRRRHERLPASAEVVLMRDSDAMRIGTRGELSDITPFGIGVVLSDRLENGEHVQVRLINHIQKVNAETRGYVRHVTPRDDGRYYIGVELQVRLQPLQVSLLQMGIRGEDEGEAPKWI